MRKVLVLLVVVMCTTANAQPHTYFLDEPAIESHGVAAGCQVRHVHSLGIVCPTDTDNPQAGHSKNKIRPEQRAEARVRRQVVMER